MRILLTGQGGFIGSRLRRALNRRGHEVPPFRIDFREALEPAAWAPHVARFDAVVNAAGIFRERQPGDFERVHAVAPIALFRAAAQAGVPLLVQVSALGADEGATTAFHLSKRAGDDGLRALRRPALVLQPSLVYGPGGASARLMNLLATLPVLPLPGGGRQPVQPIHVDDLVAAVVALLEGPRPDGPVTVALVGPEPVALRDYLAALRASLGYGDARCVAVPPRLAGPLAAVAARLTTWPIDPSALEMLGRGNVADAGATRAALGREPRGVAAFVPPDLAGPLRAEAVLEWQLPLLRLALAVMWVWTAIVSLGVYPVAESIRMLLAVGVPAALAPWALYGAALLDLAFGVATLALRRGTRALWIAQALLILGYTVVIAFRLPEHLVHPFGPIVKNLPILALLGLLLALEPPRRRTPADAAPRSGNVNRRGRAA